MNQLCFLTNVSGEQWAAWTQAICSAAAIYAAAALANRQHRIERTNDVVRKIEQQSDLADNLETVLRRLIEKLELAFAAIQRGDAAGSLDDLLSISDCAELLEEAPVADLGSADLALRLLQSRRTATSARADLVDLEEWFRGRRAVVVGREPDRAMRNSIAELRRLAADLKAHRDVLANGAAAATNASRRWTVFG